MATINNFTNCSVNINNNCIQSKACTKCTEIKPLSEFYHRNGSKDGFRSACKSCNQKYVEKNKERIAECGRKYRERNIEKIAEYMIHYRKNNKESIRSNKREYDLNCYYNNEQFRLKKLLHKRINMALKGKDKTARTQELIGCTIEYLKKWLELNFTQDMSWDNLGKYWCIDRVIPCSSFDLSVSEEQKRCFNWMNCQPLSIQDNIKKSNKREIEAEMQHALKVAKFKELMDTPLL